MLFSGELCTVSSKKTATFTDSIVATRLALLSFNSSIVWIWQWYKKVIRASNTDALEKDPKNLQEFIGAERGTYHWILLGIFEDSGPSLSTASLLPLIPTMTHQQKSIRAKWVFQKYLICTDTIRWNSCHTCMQPSMACQTKHCKILKIWEWNCQGNQNKQLKCFEVLQQYMYDS